MKSYDIQRLFFYDKHDGFLFHVIGTQLKFIFWPRKCAITDRTLWLEYAYKQTAMWTGPDTPEFQYRYYDKNEFLIAKIKGIV